MIPLANYYAVVAVVTATMTTAEFHLVAWTRAHLFRIDFSWLLSVKCHYLFSNPYAVLLVAKYSNSPKHCMDLDCVTMSHL